MYLLAVAIAWFTLNQIMGVVQAAGRNVATNLGTIDSNYITADQFITGVFMGFLIPGIFALAIWVWQYSQRVTYFGG